jgi:hypothetical protein
MSWLIRHLDRALLSIALIFSVLWIADHIRHPLAEGPPMATINDNYTPPSAPSPQPSVAMPSTLPRTTRRLRFPRSIVLVGYDPGCVKTF